MHMIHSNGVIAALLVLLVDVISANNNFEEDVNVKNVLSRDRDMEKKNLRLSYTTDGKLDINDESMMDNEKFEEDKELWERILQRDMSITSPPTPSPTSSPTSSPTLSPVIIPIPIMKEDEECELMVNVECFEVEGNARIPCNQVGKPQDEDQCLRDVIYVYRVTNSCNKSLNPNCDAAKIRTFDLVRNGVLKNLLHLLPENTVLDPGETEVYVEDDLEFDFCMDLSVDSVVRVIADTAPGMDVGMCSAEASNFFNIGFPPDLPCKVAVELTCFLEDGDERINCKDIPMPQDQNDCIKEVVYATIVTNIGDVDKAILSLDRTRDGQSASLLGLLNRRDLGPGEFAVAREEGQEIDFCVQRLVTTTVEVESEAFGVGQLECFEQVTLVFPIAITCDVDVKVECFADASRDFSVPCSDFNPFESQSLMVGCEHVHKYVYTIVNTGPGDEVIESISVSRDRATKNILDKRFNLDPDEIREVNEFQLVDYCKEFPNGISTEVVVKADMIPIGGSCEAQDAIAVFPVREKCNVALDPFIRCTVEGSNGDKVLCSVYHEQILDLDDPNQCIREVTLEYNLVNEGLACLLLYSITAEIDNEGSFDLTPAMGKTLCPEESLSLEQKIVEDFCDDDLEDRVTVIVNEGPPQTCGGFGALGFFRPVPLIPQIQECIIELDLACATATGGDCVVVQESQTKTKCDFHPCYIDLMFSAGICDSSNNSQDHFFLCKDTGDITALSSAFVTIHSFNGAEYFADIVQLEETLRLGNEYKKLDEGMIVKIYDAKGGNLVQKFKFASACATPLYANDIFGAFTVSGFGNKHHQVDATISSTSESGTEFGFTYNILNVGETEATLKEIVFFTRDTQLSSVDLSGNTVDLRRTYTGSEAIDLASISEATNITATVRADSPGNLECTALDVVTISYENAPNLDPVQCLDCPKSFLFKFSGGTCDQSSNSQDIYCTDKAAISDSVQIVITDSHFKYIFFDGKVNRGNIFEVTPSHGSFATDMVVKIIIDSDIVQIIKFHSSCSEPIFLTDVFGAIEIVGWTNSKQGVVKLY
jgi:hypothetical protein